MSYINTIEEKIAQDLCEIETALSELKLITRESLILDLNNALESHPNYNKTYLIDQIINFYKIIIEDLKINEINNEDDYDKKYVSILTEFIIESNRIINILENLKKE